jgi:hypothetical protein
VTSMPTDWALLTVRLSSLRHDYFESDSRGAPAPPLHPCPPAHPTGLCQLGGLRARHGCLHLALVSIPLATICFANAVAVARRAHLAHPLVLASGLTSLPSTLPKSFTPFPAHGHLPHPLCLVYIWLVKLPFVEGFRIQYPDPPCLFRPRRGSIKPSQNQKSPRCSQDRAACWRW